MIKKIMFVLVAVATTFLTYAQAPSNITGVVEGTAAKKVGLYKVLNGRLVEIATSTPDEKGRFGFRFVPEYEGFYSIGTGSPLSQQGFNRFYFRGNEDLNLTLNKDGYVLVGKNSKENEALYAWDQKSKSFKVKGTTPGGMSTYVDFFPEVEAMKGQIAGIGNSVKTGNATFDKLFPTIVSTDFAYYAISYLYMPRTAHPSKEEMSEYYTSFNADQYLTENLLNLPYGDRFLSSLVFRKMPSGKMPELDEQIAAIPSDVLKGQYILQRLEGARSYNDFQEMNDQYKKYFLLPEQQQRALAVETKLVETKTGVPAFQFKFPDVKGKVVGLNDLKGKVVLLDVWATWCGPCRAEEPHWEKLNEEFKNQAVAFVGISTDQDKPKWEEYVKTKHLKGIQLHAGVGNPLSTAYAVNSIPRYILIDKNGNLISADSPRPSDPKLKTLIEEWLKK
ncbi:TlpA family protein disulfide reductase [Sphingobacterium psychroaquaticum]|uniref:Thiol-disulfide isomerase or thioredoxin n=1 Tax=Sphingobacterium psychroaquaticum TaxID=561061 RepID=A0A1X7K3X3_9SPHI|nr:TlpA disulfide reductase family protein [Sphingobacterium psychroaquaticum]SMG35306.1 Thiol-disulfide isomerase or thioredoxin [Sphingobacterium psychroaquaticum]